MMDTKECRPQFGALSGRRVLASKVPIEIQQRFWSNVDTEGDGCWNWKSNPKSKYVLFRLTPTWRLFAHRLAAALWHGELEEGAVIDHLCRNTHCVNPKHLDITDQKTNLHRSIHPSMIAHVTNICKRGHSLLDAYVGIRGRTCRRCRSERRLELLRAEATS